MSHKKKGNGEAPKKGPNWARNQKNKVRRRASRQKKKEAAKLSIGVICLARTEIVRSPTPASIHDFGDPESP